MNQNLDMFEVKTGFTRKYETADINFLMAYFHGKINASFLDENARFLFELVPGTFDTILHAWLSEQSIDTEIAAYSNRVISAARAADSIEEKHRVAEKAANDRGDVNTLMVLNCAGKVYHEVHRMMGLLRFSPESDGMFTAKCSPDHFILPALAVYFTARFGETAWSIIDEKRELILSCQPGEQAKITLSNKVEPSAAKNDEWEDLWCHYHKTINNEDRNNPNLQRSLMPQRYWKYLPESKNK